MDRIDEILQMEEYAELFEPSVESIKEKYTELVKIYHPDTCSDYRAAEVFAHVTRLRDEAKKEFESGVWKKKGRIGFEMKRGGWVSLEYSSEAEFELGRRFAGEDKLLYLIESDYLEYFENAVDRIGNMKFSDANMKEEFERFLPRMVRQGITKSGAGIIILMKDRDEYPLKDILEKLDNRMDAKHVAWVISRLCNICCYLQYAGIAHNGVTIDNLFINPKKHTISLQGGWWYAVKEDTKLIGTTAEVYEQMTDRCKSSKMAECRTDQEMVHEIAKILLNNKSLVFKPKDSTDIPAAMATWIRNGSGGCAFEEFENWNKTLDDSWGKRRFVNLIVPGIN